MPYADARVLYCPLLANQNSYTSSVNRLFLPLSREAGVSLLAKVAVWLGVQDGVPDVATLGACTFDFAA